MEIPLCNVIAHFLARFALTIIELKQFVKISGAKQPGKCAYFAQRYMYLHNGKVKLMNRNQ